ncbi:hypothetical protein AOP6_1546 [Desulfuromonas sp. AOP6]|nr:hypothetical protein AOP6_1546 [Desulfuromonas sp. AOP6]
MLTPGQRKTEQCRQRSERLQFYVDCLTNAERSILAARYLRKTPAKYQRFLLKNLTIAQLAFCEVFSWENHGW